MIEEGGVKPPSFLCHPCPSCLATRGCSPFLQREDMPWPRGEYPRTLGLSHGVVFSRAYILQAIDGCPLLRNFATFATSGFGALARSCCPSAQQ